MSEADQKEQETKVTKYQTQELTDLTSFSFPVDVKLTNGKWGRVNVTTKHGIPADRMFNDFKETYKFMDMIAGDGDYAVFVGDLRAPFPLPYPNAENQSPEQPQAQNQAEKKTDPPKQNGNGHALEFPCNKLVVEYKNEKPYFSVTGLENKFPKFPIRVWGEVLEAAGITEDQVDAKKGMSLLGWTAVYVKNDEGKAQKVVELRRPEFA
jgi:hypothetical protein